MTFLHQTLPSFWECYSRLPEGIQRRADKQYELLTDSPRQGSLQLKPVGDLWSVRVTDAYRALAVRDGNIFTWFWIGTHDQYERLLSE